MRAIYLFYKGFWGPAIHILGGAGFGCRYHPSCSEYAYQAFQLHRPWKALILSIKRIIRCNPWVRRDYEDPVPPNKSTGEI